MNASPGAPHVRREVRSLGPGDPTLQYYGEAVVEMEKGSERDDPTSWLYQAAIHGTLVEPALPSWNRCTHGSWFFVAWHRMYVYYFEEIVRSVIARSHGQQAADEWALPYWNYCRGQEYASIPDAFREPTVNGTRNPLYVEQRRPGINEGRRLPDAMTESTKALARPHFLGVAEFGGGHAPPNEQFWTKTGVFEQTPHNSVHDGVGGRTGWMGNIREAAKDPIFWLHHSNIDRIWAQWMAEQPKRENPTDPKWTGQRFEFFDIHGNPASKACKEITEIEKLGYKYDAVDGVPTGPTPSPTPTPSPETEAAVPASADPPSGPRFVGASEEKLTLTGETAAIPVEIDERAREEVREASAKTDPRHLYLNIEDIEGEVNPGTVYGIYVNLPEHADAATRAEHHVGNVSFFGIELAGQPVTDEHTHNMRVSVEVGELLRALGGGEHYDGEEVHVTFYPLGLQGSEGGDQHAGEAAQGGGESPVRIGRVSLSVDA
jgi:tyrosinase